MTLQEELIIKANLINLVKSLPEIIIGEVDDFIFQDFGCLKLIKLVENDISKIFNATKTEVASVIRKICTEELSLKGYSGGDDYTRQFAKDNSGFNPLFVLGLNIIIFSN